MRKGRRKKPPRKAPNWKPERFAGFWAYYPRGEDKQRTMDIWDALQLSDEVIDEIAVALVKLKNTDEWKRGIGIPYASTWLNNARWQDADKLAAAPESAMEDGGGWADDEEVI